MGFWQKLLGLSSGPNWRSVDWLAIDGQWRAITALGKSQAQADLKQALIQADSLFDSILKQANVAGATLGERLKTLRETLPKQTYRQLWGAHLKRNELVHESGSFVADWERKQYLEAFDQAIKAVRGLR